MNREFRAALSLGVIILSMTLMAGPATAQKAPKEIKEFPALNKVVMPEVQSVTLKNGMKIYLVEDNQYPTIDLRALVRVGSINEPPEKVGLASITGTVLRTGGTERRTGDEIDKELETMGGVVETGIEQGSGYVYVSVLKEDVDKGIDLLADILMHPAFRDDKIDLAKIEMRSAISRRNDNIWEIANREFNSLIYGKSGPYGRYPEYATVDAVTRDDIKTFYTKYFQPNNIIFAAWGDFKSKDIRKKLEAAFGSWSSGEVSTPELPKVDYKYKYTINFIQKSDVNQSQIQMGHIGGLLSDPDYPALVIMNEILSTDRMFKVLRTKEGLTYEPWGYYGAEYDHPGVFSCGTQTKSSTTVYAIRMMLNEVKRITEEPVTDEELQRAKDSYLNSFVFNFDSKAKIVERMMAYAYYGYPLDFMDKLKEGVEKVTRDDVLRAAKSHLVPDKLQILVVGNKDEFAEPLSTLGDVNVIDISIPAEVSESTPEETPESIAKGKDFLARAAEASGGSDAFRKVKNMRMQLEVVEVTQMGEMKINAESTIIYPDSVCQSIDTPMGKLTIVLAGDKGWLKSPQGKMQMQETMKNEMKGDFASDPVNLFSNPDRYRVQYLGENKFGGANAVELLVTSKDRMFHLFIDPTTYLPAGITYKTVRDQGPTSIEELWSDYRDVGGFKLPHKLVNNADGKKSSAVSVLDTKCNISIPPEIFQEE